MFNKIKIKNYLLNAKFKKRLPAGTPRSPEEYLALETAKKFGDLKSLKFYKRCFKRNPHLAKWAAYQVKLYLETTRARNPGALFTHFYKKKPNEF